MTRPLRLASFVLAFCTLLSAPYAHGQNQVLGELQLQGATDAEKTAGVWVDGQYLGYLKELKGTKKVLLLPGEHQITIRQAGYVDFRACSVMDCWRWSFACSCDRLSRGIHFGVHFVGF
jgi:hypothetical protein